LKKTSINPTNPGVKKVATMFNIRGSKRVGPPKFTINISKLKL